MSVWDILFEVGQFIFWFACVLIGIGTGAAFLLALYIWAFFIVWGNVDEKDDDNY